MTTISKSALVHYSPEQMYKLVDNIEAYSEFLPWCGKATEIKRDDKIVEASLLVSYSGFNKEFTTRNRLEKNHKMEMKLVDGPFKHLEGTWVFDLLGEDACKVSLHLDFEFSSKLVSISLGPVFNQMANSLVDAFIKRAEAIYG